MKSSADNIFVSVIIPEYNGRNKIDTCLKKLDTQTFTHYEVIIVDDYSSDDSVLLINEKIKRLTHPERFRLICLSENGRAGGARNRGICEAHGSYILFMDQDDHAEPTLLAELYSKSDDAKVDCILCDIVDKNNKVYQRPSISIGTVYDKKLKKEFINCGYVLGMLIKKQIILDNNLFFPEKRMYEDSLFNCGLFACVQSVSKVDRALYIREVDAQSQTAFLNQKKLEDRIQATRWYLKSFKENPKIKDLAEEINIIAAYYIYASCTWWMLCDKTLYSSQMMNTCLHWAKSHPFDWNKLKMDAVQRGFGKRKISILKI